MESAESDKVSSEVAFEQARAWKDKGATLLLSISRQPDKRADVCDKLPVTILDVTDSSLSFRWQLDVVDPDGPTQPFASAHGTFVVWLGGVTFAALYSPRKSLNISRGHYQCVLTEFSASAFG
jgi:hypothetical protein